MKDITMLINKYRECIRNLWNIYFLDQLLSMGGQWSFDDKWDFVDEFDDICKELFSALVLSPINYTSFKKSSSYKESPQPLLFLHVIPTGQVPIQINREVKRSGYWDYPINYVGPEDVDLRFIDFFDFDELNFRDLEYCLVRIINSNNNPDLQGRDALISPKYVKVFLASE